MGAATTTRSAVRSRRSARVRRAHAQRRTDAVYVSGFEETDLPHAPDTVGVRRRRRCQPTGSRSPARTIRTAPATHDDATAMNADIIEPRRAESLVEDDLDEADFYAGQGMYPEAMDALRVLLAAPSRPSADLKRRCARSRRWSAASTVDRTRRPHGLDGGVDIAMDTPVTGAHRRHRRARSRRDRGDRRGLRR